MHSAYDNLVITMTVLYLHSCVRVKSVPVFMLILNATSHDENNFSTDPYSNRL